MQSSLKRKISLLLPAFIFIWVIQGCRKEKLDGNIPLTGVQVSPAQASSIRLFNFYNTPLDMRVNNIPLTNFSTSGSAQGNQIGLSIFPKGVWGSSDDGSPVTLPASLLDKQQQLHIVIQTRGAVLFPGLESMPMLRIDTTITNDPLHLKDYYVMANGHLKVIDRNVAAPSSSDRFKIRIMNFGNVKDSLGLSGNLILTYADGTPVNQALNSVANDATSGYVELPYGSYQFKLYVAKSPGVPDYTKQLAELPVYPDLSQGMFNSPQQNLVTRVRGFKPGGTYSIVVTPAILGYNMSNNGEVPTFFVLNTYRIITEQSAPMNTSWARILSVNAFSNNTISFTIDGQQAGTNLLFGQQGDYTTVVQGNHTVQATDASGNVLASSTIKLYPYDNMTAWLYNNNGKPTILFTNTDMTTTLYESAAPNVVDDGTDGSKNTIQFTYALQARFLNLSDVPYVTFTKDGALFNPYLSGNAQNPKQADTLAYPQAFINMQIGQPTVYNPFVVFPNDNPDLWFMTQNGVTYIEGFGSNKMGLARSNPLPIRAFQSQPAQGNYNAQIPGSLLQTIKPLVDKDFSTGNLIYGTNPPRAENGFYTVALIGSANGTSGMPAGKLIVVKHNK